MIGIYTLKIKIKTSVSMPSQLKHRSSMHNMIKTYNMAIKHMQLDAYTENIMLKIDK